MYWWLWIAGAAVLVIAGAVTGFRVVRAPARTRAVSAWADAQAALDAADISRLACDPRAAQTREADDLLQQATTLAAERGGRDAAVQVRRWALTADRLYRGAGS